MPGPAGPPETGERMTQVLQVVALDDQRPVAQRHPNHRAGPPVLEQNPTADWTELLGHVAVEKDTGGAADTAVEDVDELASFKL